MPITTISKVEVFLDSIRKSSLLKPNELESFLDRFSWDGSPSEMTLALARQLVAEGLLSRFQCEQLLQGRWRNFHLAGKYRVYERLGIGPMSTVLLCEHVMMRRLVALKLLPADQAKDPATLARFHREARASARLRHPNVVAVYDLDSVDGLNFLVVEFIDGSDLQRVVDLGGPMSIDRAANYLCQAAEGLQHAHEKGLVHRDIKPANLVLDRSGVVKLLDLGLARLFSDPGESGSVFNERGMLLGTIDYLAPEQAVDSHDVDIRADIYSLGATAFYLLSGRTLFEGASTIQKLALHSQRPTEQIVRELSGIPKGFADILIKMLAKDPEERYQTPAEVAQALAPWTTEAVHLPTADEMPNLSPATRRAIERSGNSVGSSMPLRVSTGRTSSDMAIPSIIVDEESISRSDIRLAVAEKASSSKRNWIVGVGLMVGVVLGMGGSGSLLDWNSSDSTTRPRTVAKPLNLGRGEVPQIPQDNYLKLDLTPVASVVTTQPMFHEPGSPEASTERLVFDDWSPRTFSGVPFHLVDPKGDTVPNAIMLYSPRGVTPPKMPSAVSLKVNTRVKDIHFLGGISGWGAKTSKGPPTVSMIVRLLYADGKVEDHPLQDGVYFSDFVQIADVPGSVLAFRLHNRHLRYFSITPKRAEKITQIELIKGPNETAPIIMAITLEQPDR
jgi:serine/threonine protein kinase